MLNKNLSIRKRIFGAMLLISMIPILLLAYFSINISQTNMQNYIIQNRTLGMEWLNDKLSKELKEYADLFYTIEVNKDIKKSITSWVIGSKENNNIINEIRTDFEETLNQNANIQSIEIYNYSTGEGYIATRQSFKTGKWEELDSVWDTRSSELQTNVVQ